MRRWLASILVVAGCGGAAASPDSSPTQRPAPEAPRPVAPEAARSQLAAAWSSAAGELGAWRIGTFRFADATRAYEGTAAHTSRDSLELRGAAAVCVAHETSCSGASGPEPLWALFCGPDAERLHASFFAPRAAGGGFASGVFPLLAATMPYTFEPPCGQPRAGDGLVDLRAAAPTFEDTLAVFPAAVQRDVQAHHYLNAERLFDVEVRSVGLPTSLRITFGSEAAHVIDGTEVDDRWLQTSTTYDATVRAGSSVTEPNVTELRLVRVLRYDCRQRSTRVGHARVLWPPAPYDDAARAGCRPL